MCVEAEIHIECKYPDVDHSISPVTLQRVELQVALEVTSIEARDGQTVPIPSLDGKTITHKELKSSFMSKNLPKGCLHKITRH